jgi:hypothetical protein
MRNERGDYIPSAEEAVAVALAMQRTEEPPAPVPEIPADVIKRLEGELATLRSRLDAINAATKRGDVQAVAGCDLRELAIQVATVENALKLARESAAEAERQSSQGLRAQRLQQFQQLTEQARQSRAEFQRAFASASVALGAYCEATRKAIWLNHEIRGGAAFPDPERENQLSDLTNRALLSPQNALMDQGYKPTMDYGYDISISIPPLIAPEKGKSL